MMCTGIKGLFKGWVPSTIDLKKKKQPAHMLTASFIASFTLTKNFLHAEPSTPLFPLSSSLIASLYSTNKLNDMLPVYDSEKLQLVC